MLLVLGELKAQHIDFKAFLRKNIKEADAAFIIKPGLQVAGIPTYRRYFSGTRLDSINNLISVSPGLSGAAELWILRTPYFGYAYTGEYALGWLFTSSYRINQRGHMLYAGTRGLRATAEFLKTNRSAYGQIYGNDDLGSTETYNRYNSEYRNVRRMALGVQVNVGGNTFLAGKYIREKFAFTDPEYYSNAVDNAKGFEVSVFDPKVFSLSLELLLKQPVSAIMSTTTVGPNLKQEQPYFKLTLSKSTDFSLFKYNDINFLRRL